LKCTTFLNQPASHKYSHQDSYSQKHDTTTLLHTIKTFTLCPHHVSPYHSCASTSNDLLNFLSGCHRGITRSC
jgi:GTP cyclohydrolase I